MSNFRRALLLSGLVFSVCGFSKTFSTQFIKFEIPPNWTCALEEIDWVCQPDNLVERSEVILTVVTKAVNDVDDTFDKYEVAMKNPRDMRDLLGNAYKSQVNYVRRRSIRNHIWIDGLQLGSEIPGYYSRYIASIEQKVAGMISYSIAESVYPKWAPVMDNVVETAQIFFDPKAFAELSSKTSSLLPKDGRGKMSRIAPVAEGGKKSDDGGGGTNPLVIGGAILALAGAAYYFYKKKQKGG